MQSSGFAYAPVGAESVFESAISAIVETTSNSRLNLPRISQNFWPSGRLPDFQKAPVTTFARILEAGQSIFHHTPVAPTSASTGAGVVSNDAKWDYALSQDLDVVLGQYVDAHPA